MSFINILFLINILYFSIILIIEIFFSDMNLYTSSITLIFLLIVIIFMLYVKIIRKRNIDYLEDRKPLFERSRAPSFVIMDTSTPIIDNTNPILNNITNSLIENSNKQSKFNMSEDKTFYDNVNSFSDKLALTKQNDEN